MNNLELQQDYARSLSKNPTQSNNLVMREFEIKEDNYQHFQVKGKEIAEYCNVPFSKVLPLFTNPNWTHEAVCEAFRRMKKTDVKSIRYLIGIIKNLV